MDRINLPKMLTGSCLILFIQTSCVTPAFSQMPYGAPSDPSDSFRIARPVSTQMNQVEATTFLKGGIVKHQNGDDQGAMLDFQQAVNLDPSNSDAHFNLAAIEEARGEIGPALAEYRAVLQYNPNDQSAIAAVNQLRVAVAGQSNFQEKPVLQGSARETSLLPSANAFAPPLMQGAAGAAVNAPQPILNAKASKTKQPKPPKTKGGTLRALKAIGSIALKTAVAASNSGLMYYGGAGAVDTCACNNLGN
jgi:tetratricopeptide (TPR) repeat protein